MHITLKNEINSLILLTFLSLDAYTVMDCFDNEQIDEKSNHRNER